MGSATAATLVDTSATQLISALQLCPGITISGTVFELVVLLELIQGEDAEPGHEQSSRAAAHYHTRSYSPQ